MPYEVLEMMVAPESYADVYKDSGYEILSRTFNNIDLGEGHLATDYPAQNVIELRVENYGPDNMLRRVTYKTEYSKNLGSIVEVYRKKDVSLDR